jgi:hypothetical protein
MMSMATPEYTLHPPRLSLNAFSKSAQSPNRISSPLGSGNVVSPEVVRREPLATLLVSGVDNAPRLSAKLFGALLARSHLNGPSGRPFIESVHDLHEPTSQHDDRAP